LTQRALVTGGCGFIGSHLLDVLTDHGFETLTVDILFHKTSLQNIRHLEGRIELNQTDIRDTKALREIFDRFRPHHVYHLAAHHYIPYCNQYPIEAIDTNLLGTQNVADACSAYGVERLFFASTAAVYGISDHPHQETQLPDPLDVYGVTKAAGEKIAAFTARNSKTKVRIGRFFNAVGNRETNPHIIPEIVTQLRANPSGPLKLGNVSPKRDYIHAADLADSSFAVLNRGEETLDTVNLGSGCEYSVRDLVGLFEIALQRKIEIISDPERVRKNDRPHLCADVSKLHQEYNWKQTHSLQEAIDELSQQIRSDTRQSAPAEMALRAGA